MSRYKMYRYELAWVGDDRRHLKIWMCETYAPLLKEYFPEIKFDFRDGLKGTCTAILSLTNEEEQAIRNLLDIFKNHVLLKKNEHIDPYFEDELDQCFALDYNLEELPGTNITEYTRYGSLENKAKENKDESARGELVEAFVYLCEKHPLYRKARIVIPIPPNPSKIFHLPMELASELAERTGKKDGSALIRKVKETPRL